MEEMRMTFLDRVRNVASDALEQGKDAAQTQQLKLQLRKLQSELRDAQAAFGEQAFALYEAGTLSSTSELDGAAQQIRDSRLQIEAKQAELRAVGEEPTDAPAFATDDDEEPAPPTA
jgi:hypothetical protein